MPQSENDDDVPFAQVDLELPLTVTEYVAQQLVPREIGWQKDFNIVLSY
jgi:hypothetical protein